jgi:hypothetical protein
MRPRPTVRTISAAVHREPSPRRAPIPMIQGASSAHGNHVLKCQPKIRAKECP